MPQADIYVYHNQSTDDTSEQARKAGAIVKQEHRKGKGNVVRRMFSDIDADVYLMVDGDGTYDSKRAHDLVNLLINHEADMVIGRRVEVSASAHRQGHKWGNWLFNTILKFVFSSHFKDILSGYRVFSKRFVKTFPAMSNGFDIETEMSVFALNLKLHTIEVDTDFFDRIEGTESKLSTFKDGFKIALRIFNLFREFRPLYLFSLIALALTVFCLILGFPLIMTYMETQTVPRMPTAMICVGLGILSVMSITLGLILDGIALLRRETLKVQLNQYSHKNLS
ncbi:MAG: glycosyltransferase [Alphaproteobacteria bacterium]|nr:glycosyltransferase [Alphaproteobacteria bacterium]